MNEKYIIKNRLIKKCKMDNSSSKYKNKPKNKQ